MRVGRGALEKRSRLGVVRVGRERAMTRTPAVALAGAKSGAVGMLAVPGRCCTLQTACRRARVALSVKEL